MTGPKAAGKALVFRRKGADLGPRDGPPGPAQTAYDAECRSLDGQECELVGTDDECALVRFADLTEMWVFGSELDPEPA